VGKDTASWLMKNLGFWILIVVVLGVAGVGGVGFLGRRWDGTSRFTVIFFEDGVRVDSFDPQIGKGVRMALPSDLKIESVAGKGEWNIGVLDKAAKNFGWTWAADSISDYLGLVYTTHSREFPLWDKLEWWRVVKKIEWSEVNMEDLGVITRQREPDGQEYWQLNGNWDEVARGMFLSTEIANQGWNVIVVNSTGIGGAGSRAARLLENMGMKVRDVSVGETQEKCQLKTGKERRNWTGVKLVERLWGCEWVEGSEESEMIVVLGRSYGRWWRGV